MTLRRALAALSVLAMVIAPACKKDRDNTKIVVAVWSDLAVPTELDEIRVEVVGPTQTGTKTFPLTGPGKLPVQLELVPLGDKNATFAVKAVGLRSLVEGVSQTARVSFVSGKALLLKLFLGRACQGKTCTGDYTCAQGICDQPIAVGTLPPYDPNNLQGPDAGPRPDSSVGLDTGPIPDGRGNEPVAPESNAREVGAEAIPDAPITPPGTGGAGGWTGRDGPSSSGGAGGSTGPIGSGGVTSVDASGMDAIATDAPDVPLSGGTGGVIVGAGGATGTGGVGGGTGGATGGTGGTGGSGGATGGGGATGTGGAMETCVFGTSRFGNCKFGP